MYLWKAEGTVKCQSRGTLQYHKSTVTLPIILTTFLIITVATWGIWGCLVLERMTELPGHWQVMPPAHTLGDNQGGREAVTLISMAFSCPQVHNRICPVEFGSACYFSSLCHTFPLFCNTDLTSVVHMEKRTSMQRWFWELNCKESHWGPSYSEAHPALDDWGSAL